MRLHTKESELAWRINKVPLEKDFTLRFQGWVRVK